MIGFFLSNSKAQKWAIEDLVPVSLVQSLETKAPYYLVTPLCVASLVAPHGQE